jgi:hypothetical protein
MPPGRQAVVAPALALHADEVAPEIVGALEAQGLHPAEQISLCWLRRRQAESDAGNAIKLPPWYASRGAEIVAALTPLRRPPTRQSVAPLPQDAAAKFSPARRPRNLFSPCTRPRSNYACVWGREGNEAFIVGDYRGEYWR